MRHIIIIARIIPTEAAYCFFDYGSIVRLLLLIESAISTLNAFAYVCVCVTWQ